MEEVSLVNVNREGQVKPQVETGRKPENERRYQLTVLALPLQRPLAALGVCQELVSVTKSRQQ